MNKSAKLGAAQDWLIEIEFNKWYRFDEIPDGMFEDVFGLIEERFRGWLYFFDDFDQSFYKTLEYKKNHYEVNRENVFENQLKQQSRRDARKAKAAQNSTIDVGKVLTYRSQC